MPTQTFFNLKEAKQDRIICAALTEFAKHGYKNSNLDRIVKIAGIPKGSLYQYFENKDDLFVFISRKAIQSMWKLFQEHMEESPARDCFDMFAKALFFAMDLREREPDLTLLYIQTGFLQDTCLRYKILPDILQKNNVFMKRFFSWGIGEGLIDQNLNIKAAKFFLDAISNRFQEKVLFKDSLNSELIFTSRAEMEDFIENLLALLRKAFAKQGPLVHNSK